MRINGHGPSCTAEFRLTWDALTLAGSTWVTDKPDLPRFSTIDTTTVFLESPTLSSNITSSLAINSKNKTRRQNNTQSRFTKNHYLVFQRLDYKGFLTRVLSNDSRVKLLTSYTKVPIRYIYPSNKRHQATITAATTTTLEYTIAPSQTCSITSSNPQTRGFE
jgi:hypothetical protein